MPAKKSKSVTILVTWCGLHCIGSQVVARCNHCGKFETLENTFTKRQDQIPTVEHLALKFETFKGEHRLCAPATPS